MARLDKEQWAIIRERWEGDPRYGYAWVVTELSLSISSDAVKKRASRDNWAKRTSLKKIVEYAQKQADRKFVPQFVPVGTSNSDGDKSSGIVFVSGLTDNKHLFNNLVSKGVVFRNTPHLHET